MENSNQLKYNNMNTENLEKKEYKLIRNFVSNDERKALTEICRKYKKLPYLLEAKHTSKCFVWVDKDES